MAGYQVQIYCLWTHKILGDRTSEIVLSDSRAMISIYYLPQKKYIFERGIKLEYVLKYLYGDKYLDQFARLKTKRRGCIFYRMLNSFELDELLNL